MHNNKNLNYDTDNKQITHRQIGWYFFPTDCMFGTNQNHRSHKYLKLCFTARQRNGYYYTYVHILAACAQNRKIVHIYNTCR